MPEDARYKAQAKILEQAIEDCLDLEEDGGLPIAWITLVAVRRGDNLEQVTHMYLAPEGQPHYATVGLLQTNLDTIRGITNETDWTDG